MIVCWYYWSSIYRSLGVPQEQKCDWIFWCCIEAGCHVHKETGCRDSSRNAAPMVKLKNSEVVATLQHPHSLGRIPE